MTEVTNEGRPAGDAKGVSPCLSLGAVSGRDGGGRLGRGVPSEVTLGPWLSQMEGGRQTGRRQSEQAQQGGGGVGQARSGSGKSRASSRESAVAGWLRGRKRGPRKEGK